MKNNPGSISSANGKIGKQFILTGRQKQQLFKLVNDSTNFSNGECGTFFLNAGFLIDYKKVKAGKINIGCGFNQWNFEPENKAAKYGGLSKKGFKNMERLIDEINLGK
jgi:hypothetical protein